MSERPKSTENPSRVPTNLDRDVKGDETESQADQSPFKILQIVQPEITALRILQHLKARDDISSQSRGTDTISSTPRRGTELKENAKESDSFLRDRLRLGLPLMAGTLEIYRPSDTGSSHMREDGTILLQTRFHMPSWLSCLAVVDFVLRRSYCGWKRCLTSYIIIPRESDLHRIVLNLLARDDLDGLRRMFQEKDIYHTDRLLSYGADVTLLAVAMGLQSWNTSNYLLDCGSEQQVLFPCYNRPGIRTRTSEEFEKVLKNGTLRDDVRLYIFPRFGPLSQDISTLRRMAWSDQEYFSSDFRDCRHKIACESTYSIGIRPDFFRHVLSKSGYLKHGDIDFNWPRTGEVGLWHGLARGVGHTGWTAQCWSGVTSEILQLASCFEDLCAVRWIHHPWGPLSYVTPFLCLFMTSFWAFPTEESRVENLRKRKIHARLDACDEVMKLWLSSVRRAGFDLREYGTREKQQASVEGGNSRNFNIFRDISADDRTTNGRMEIRLISFTYGREVVDWKLWWSEPTDELVGDFWRDMDPEPLFLPGSWVDEA
ncbi:hypothetical protein NPX13_g7779 [Xylaria arbuscula]|uniref:Uncharacterized protein n=1 Tax=Xylaria arbuscula TaxID=114810 RepID=A0A9W8N9D6_9PEZI|nr:hypothetical protein NPX13_g7779 [Xylaria arbuscula]